MKLKPTNYTQFSWLILALAFSLLVLTVAYASSSYLRVTVAVGVSILTLFLYKKNLLIAYKSVKRRESKRAEKAEKDIIDLELQLNEQKQISKELTKSKERFREAAFYDKLTHLPNRNYVIDTLESLLSINQANPKYRFGVLYLDLNQFKNINNSLGHSFGDKLLIQVAKRLKECAYDSSIVAHFGSDEFAIVLTDISNKEKVISLAKKLCREISLPYNFDNREIFTSISLGVVYSKNVYKNVEDILRDADIAMYQAKRKNAPFVVFDQSMHDSVFERLQIETDLRKAISRNEFSLVYQPLIDLRSLRFFGFESLIRWHHPTKGLIKPNNFIPVAEDTGLIIPITEWCLRESCSQLKIWQKLLDPSLIVSVNLSRKHLTHPNLIEQIQRILVETNFNPMNLKIEITEGAIMEDAETAIKTLNKLKDLDIKLSIDDFGTGYSSLSYLHKFPINTIKIDRSFIKIIDDEGANDEMVKTIVTMAKNLNLDVIAEGVETQTQFETLQNVQCEYAQGYLFSYPLSKEAINNLLRNSIFWQGSKNSERVDFIKQMQLNDVENANIG